MSGRSVLAVAVLVAWVAALGWHVRREYFGSMAERLAEAARTLPPGVAYYTLERGDRPAGWGVVELDTLPANAGFRLTRRFHSGLPSLGAAGESETLTTARFGASLKLRSFEVLVHTPQADVRISGELARDSTLRVIVDRSDAADTLHLRVDPWITLPAAWGLRLAAHGDAEPGDRFEVPVFDPSALVERRMAVTILERAPRAFADSADVDAAGRWFAARRDTVPAWRVRREIAGVETVAWIDADGRVVNGEAPGGARMVRTAFELAFFRGR